MKTLRPIALFAIAFTHLASFSAFGQTPSSDAPLCRFLEQGRWGFMNVSGRTVVPAGYDFAYPYRDGFTIVRMGSDEKGKRAYLDASGKQITGFDFDGAFYFYGSLARVYAGGKYAYITKSGTLATKFEFDFATDFDGEVGVVRVGDRRTGKYGLVRPDGSAWFGDFYDSIDLYQEFSASGIGVYRKGQLSGYLTRDGKKLTEAVYGSAGRFTNGLAVVKYNNKYGIIDEKGAFVVNPLYDSISGWMFDGFTNGSIPATLGGKQGFIDRNGMPVFEFRYSGVQPYVGDTAVVMTGKNWNERKYGLVDRNGQEILSPRYEALSLFGIEGVAIVRQNGKFGLIDLGGRVICEPQYDWIDPFSEGLAAVSLNGKWGFLNTRGELVAAPVWDMAYDFSEGLAVVRTGTVESGKRGYVAADGRIAISPQFDWAYSFHDGIAHVAFGDYHTGTFGYIDKTGRFVKQPGN